MYLYADKSEPLLQFKMETSQPGMYTPYAKNFPCITFCFIFIEAPVLKVYNSFTKQKVT